MNPELANLTVERMTDKGYLDDDGQFVNVEEGQEFATALGKSFAEQTATYWTEQQGELIAKSLTGLGLKIKPKLPKGLVSTIEKTQKLSAPFYKMIKKGKLDGMIPELVEEYVDRIIKPVLMLDDQYRDIDEDYIERVAFSFVPDPRELLAQVILFSALPVGGTLSGFLGRSFSAATQYMQSGKELPDVYTRAVLEGNLMKEYGLDRTQAFEVADVIDGGGNIDDIEQKVRSYGNADFTIEDVKGLTEMLVERGALPQQAKRVAEAAQMPATTPIPEPTAVKTGGKTEIAAQTTPEGVTGEIQAGKQPWEMMVSKYRAFVKKETMPQIPEEKMIWEPLDDYHKKQVQQALSEGKPVPREVLEEYRGKEWAAEALAKLTTPPAPKNGVEDAGEGLKEEATKPAKAVSGIETYEGTGELKTRGLAKSIESAAVEKALTETFSDIPEYRAIKIKDQAKLVADFINSDYDRAKRVAMGQESAPQGIIPEMVLAAISNKAVADADVNTLRDIATQSNLLELATTFGQRIRMLGELGEHSAVRAIRKIVSARKKTVAKRTENLNKTIKDDVGNVKESIKKARGGKNALREFILSLQC
jgi:hypothetical protein